MAHYLQSNLTIAEVINREVTGIDKEVDRDVDRDVDRELIEN